MKTYVNVGQEGQRLRKRVWGYEGKNGGVGMC